jgi:hypothetical protein
VLVHLLMVHFILVTRALGLRSIEISGDPLGSASLLHPFYEGSPSFDVAGYVGLIC